MQGKSCEITQESFRDAELWKLSEMCENKHAKQSNLGPDNWESDVCDDVER